MSEIERERASRAVAEQQAKVGSPAAASSSSSAKETGDAEKNPAILSPRWEDASGQAITKALVGDEVYLCAHVTDITDGAATTIKIVEKDADAIDDEVATLSAVVSGGRIKCKWQVKYTADEDDADSRRELAEKGYTLPEYAFTVEVRLVRPEITKAQWQDAEGSVTGRGLVGRPLRLVAETRDMEGGVTFHVHDGEGREVASLGAEIVEGRAEAQWTPADPRAPDDTRELRYRLQVTGNRCRKAAGGEVQVRNPRVVSMEWEEDFAYPGDTVKLKVTSFEMKEFDFSGVLNFYDKHKFFNSEPLFSKDITIDADEKVVEVELPADKLNMTYKDDAGFAKLCAEFMVEDISYSYVGKETLDILIDFERE